jgi:hypothetical protein
MIRAVIAANKEHEKFVVAAESSLDAFYILESVRDDAKNIVDFRFSYVNANGEKRLGSRAQDCWAEPVRGAALCGDFERPAGKIQAGGADRDSVHR